MSLTPGTRLGPYEVTAQIGVGGMGEVYRATDTNLKRSVAIKVLPESVAGDRDRLARFQREAEVLAALNHPNIAHIHGLEKADGVTALVMELVEGPTLADRIAQGPIPIDEALPIAKQIADALEAAHEQGIIHRDLKPANVKVRPDGTVKVLDFGLAKALEPAGALGSASASMSPTITSPAMTQMGMILGTAAYMAPEQARGRAVDRRADIWAFGVVLYEMLTGRGAFQGEDVSLTLSAVLQREPDWTALPSLLPSGLNVVIHQCLQKDPRRRMQAIGDVRLALDGAFDAAMPASPQTPGRAVGWPQSRVALVASAALVIGAMAGAAAFRMRPATPSTAGPLRRGALVVTVDGSVAVRLDEAAPALDPAGRLLVVTGFGEDGTTRLFARRLDQTDASPIPGTEGVVGAAALSPDGTWLAFFSNGQLRKVALRGGAPQPIHAMAEAPLGIAWAGPDSLIVGEAGGLVQVPADGGAATAITSVEGETEIAHRWPSVTADGKTLAYVVWTGGMPSRVRVRSLESGEERTLMIGDGPRVSTSGHLIFARDQTLWAARFNRQSLAVEGEAVPVQSSVDSLLNGSVQYDISSDGLLVYTRRLDRAAPLALLDRSGAEIGSVGEAFLGVNHGPPALSPDGSRLAVTRHRTGGGDEIVIYDLRRKSVAAVGGTSDSRFPAWSPDGTRLTFASTRNGSYELVEVPADLGTPPQVILERDGDQAPGSWSPDGSALAFTEGVTGSVTFWTLRPGGEPTQLPVTAAVKGFPLLSLDGRWLAYQSDESGRLEVYVQGYPDPGQPFKVSTDGGSGPKWARDGLYYQDSSAIRFVPLAAIAGRQTGVTPQRLMSVSADADDGAFAVSPDGRTFVTIQDQSPPAGSVQMVVNWFEELKRLAPTN